MIAYITHLDLLVQYVVDSDRSQLFIHLYTWITYLGDARAITIMGLAMALILVRRKHVSFTLGLAVSIFGSLAASYFIKLIVERPRPLPPYSLFHEIGYSFPSLHATCAIAMYGFVAYVIYKLVHPPHHRVPAVIFLSTLIALIGFSRVYLGVHYASDVLGGYVIGGMFLALGIATAQALSGRGRAES